MKVIAMDDEKIMLDNLQECISEAIKGAEIFAFNKADGVEECMENNQIDVAFLDIKMPGINGIQMAKRLKVLNPKINIVFCTGYDEYTMEAIGLHASGYILKPVTAEKISKAIENLIYPIEEKQNKRVRFECFGKFMAYCDGKPIVFQYNKTTEFLAYLVDAKGSFCRMAEIEVNLFDEGNHTSYISNLRVDLLKKLKELGVDDIIVNSWGKMAIDRKKVSCDYYDWLDGTANGINSYQGEYMTQYPWSIDTENNIERGRL